MKKTYIVEVCKTLKKHVAIELNDEDYNNPKLEAENIAWDLANNGELDFDWVNSEEVEASFLGQSSLSINKLWKDEDLYDMEDFCYKESDKFDKKFLKEE